MNFMQNSDRKFGIIASLSFKVGAYISFDIAFSRTILVVATWITDPPKAN